MLEKRYAIPMKVQAMYALLCIAWNGVVMWQVHAGVVPIGPTGSSVVITGAVIFVVFLSFALRTGKEKTYLALAAIVFLLALSAVLSSISGRSDAWPSEFWRTSGILVNAIGVVSFVIAITVYVRGRSS